MFLSEIYSPKLHKTLTRCYPNRRLLCPLDRFASWKSNGPAAQFSPEPSGSGPRFSFTRPPTLRRFTDVRADKNEASERAYPRNAPLLLLLLLLLLLRYSDAIPDGRWPLQLRAGCMAWFIIVTQRRGRGGRNRTTTATCARNRFHFLFVRSVSTRGAFLVSNCYNFFFFFNFPPVHDRVGSRWRLYSATSIRTYYVLPTTAMPKKLIIIQYVLPTATPALPVSLCGPTIPSQRLCLCLR